MRGLATFGTMPLALLTTLCIFSTLHESRRTLLDALSIVHFPTDDLLTASADERMALGLVQASSVAKLQLKSVLRECQFTSPAMNAGFLHYNLQYRVKEPNNGQQ